MKNIVIFGASGHARVLIDIIEREKKYNILGLVDQSMKKNSKLMGYPILGNDIDFLSNYKLYFPFDVIIAIGDNWKRSLVAEEVSKNIPMIKFASVFHPSAQIGRDVSVGQGCVISAGAVINPNTIIGDHCIINTNASLDHDSKIGSFVNISPNATTGGNVTVKNYSTISLGANVIHNVTISENTVIGAGALVIKDIPESVVAFGVPAKIIRKREKDESYL